MKTEQQLDELISALSKERTPQRDLWPDLQQALQNTPQDTPEDTPPVTEESTGNVIPLRRPRWMTWAGAGAIAASVLLAVVMLPTATNAPDITEPGNTFLAQQGDDEAAEGAWMTQAVASRINVLNQVLPQLDELQQIPEGFSNWQQQLAIWNNASEQLEQALSLQPNNRLLQRQYQTLQRQNAQYLQRLLILSQA